MIKALFCASLLFLFRVSSLFILLFSFVLLSWVFFIFFLLVLFTFSLLQNLFSASILQVAHLLSLGLFSSPFSCFSIESELRVIIVGKLSASGWLIPLRKMKGEKRK